MRLIKLDLTKHIHMILEHLIERIIVPLYASEVLKYNSISKLGDKIKCTVFIHRN